ncbi:MAG TPA: thioesterase [Bacteroidales bacterium]|nr:thioesterase [Bacteroidales bacterium]HRW94477.1 thioesterase [Bacteroidales bacterium]
MKEVRSITCYETDPAKNLKPFAFMNIAQELANRDAVRLGFGYDRLMELDTLWVLSRMEVRFLRTPVWRETIEIDTWHKGEDGIFSLRDFLIRDEKGTENLVAATSSWLIINLKTRRIQRPQRLFDDTSLSDKTERHAIETPCGKIEGPVSELLQTAGHKTVSFSDIDFNGHVNNAKYIEWIMDYLDPVKVTSRKVDGFRINFNNEAHLDDSVDIMTAPVNSSTDYVEGVNEGKNIFRAEISFRP